MDRRVSGGLVLVLALLLALVVPNVLNPPRVDGTASTAPPAPPPVVGACIQAAVSGYSVSADGRLQTFEPVVEVPCTAPHRGEIVRVETAPARFDPYADPNPVDTLMSGCWTDTVAHWGVRVDDWTPQMALNVGVISPSPRQAAAGQTWMACTVGLYEETLDRTLAALSTDGGVPPLVGSCSMQTHPDPGAYLPAGCTQPHNHEDFGSRELRAGSTLTQDELTRSCTELIVAATGRADLASDPGLLVETQVYALFASGEGDVVPLPLPTAADRGFASCALHTTGDLELTASLRRFGDGPLPFAP